MAKAPADIRSLARKHTEAAVRTLVGIMAQPKAPASARVSAAEALLSRGWGKPKENVDLNVGAQDTLAELLREINGGSRGLPNRPVE